MARFQQALEQFPVVEASDAVAGFKLGMAGGAETVGVGVALIAEHEAHGAGLVGGYGERPVDGVVQALAAGVNIPGHAVQRGQQLTGKGVISGERRCGTSWCRTPRRWSGWWAGHSS